MANKIDVFDENYIRNLTDKWLTNIVIPQVYDDSLSYYEEINKILGCLSDISKAVDEYQYALDKNRPEVSKPESVAQEAVNPCSNYTKIKHINFVY